VKGDTRPFRKFGKAYAAPGGRYYIKRSQGRWLLIERVSGVYDLRGKFDTLGSAVGWYREHVQPGGQV
jgi:hypothetical protein